MQNPERNSVPNIIGQKQANNAAAKALDFMQGAQSEAGVLRALFESFRNFFSGIGKPVFKPRRVFELSPPDSSTLNQAFSEVHEDLSVIIDQYGQLGRATVRNFNFSVTERLRLRNMVKKVAEKVSSYIVSANNTRSWGTSTGDTFTSLDKVDRTSSAFVAADEGVVTLARTKSSNVSSGALVSIVPERCGPRDASGKLLPFVSNFLVMKHKPASTEDASEKKDWLVSSKELGDEWEMLASTAPNGDIYATLDGKPDSMFEYQLINVPEGYKKSPPEPSSKPDTKGYNWKWSNGISMYGGQDGDTLRLCFTVDLLESRTINWINLNPYIPRGSNVVLTVSQLETGEDNHSWYSVYKDGEEPVRISESPVVATHSQFNDSKYLGQGVWTFPSRTARYIRFTIETATSYAENIGHIFFIHAWKDKTVKTSHFLFFETGKSVTYTTGSERIESAVDYDKFISLVAGPAQGQNVGGNEQGKLDPNVGAGIAGGVGAGVIANSVLAGGLAGALIPGIIVIAAAVVLFAVAFGTTTSTTRERDENYMGQDVYEDGWRYCIGLRDVGINAYDYAKSSTLVSAPLPMVKEPQAVSLEVMESIPQEVLASDWTKKNQWIKYYISVDGDGTEWHPISPLSHTPLNAAGSIDPSFPPKTVIINSSLAKEQQDPSLLYIDTGKPVRSIRFKAEFFRPVDNAYQNMTPVLSKYTFRIQTKEAPVE